MISFVVVGMALALALVLRRFGTRTPRRTSPAKAEGPAAQAVIPDGGLYRHYGLPTLPGGAADDRFFGDAAQGAGDFEARGDGGD